MLCWSLAGLQFCPRLLMYTSEGSQQVLSSCVSMKVPADAQLVCVYVASWQMLSSCVQNQAHRLLTQKGHTKHRTGWTSYWIAYTYPTNKIESLDSRRLSVPCPNCQVLGGKAEVDSRNGSKWTSLQTETALQHSKAPYSYQKVKVVDSEKRAVQMNIHTLLFEIISEDT